MSQQEIQDLIDQSVSIAINRHNRNASMVSAALGFVFIYFFFFALITGAAFAFMWKSMDLMFKELDKPPQKIHPEMRDIKPNDELLVFKIKEED